MTIAERITARLDAMESAARAATPGPWAAHNMPNGFAPMVISDGTTAVAETFDKPNLADAAHIALNDPAAVLGLVDGLRKVVTLHRQWIVTDEEGSFAACETCESAEGPQSWPCPTLNVLAAALGVSEE